MDLSNEAEARSLVSGEKSTSLTSALWPVILARGFLSSAGFHKNKVKSSEPDTKRSGAEPCSTRKGWGYPHRGHKDLNSPVLTTNSTYPNFIISLQSFLLQFFHWGKTKCLLHDNILVQTSKPESKCSHWNSTTMKHLQDPYTIQWGPGGWRWQLQVQKLQCAGRSLCWEPGCSPSGRDPAESCTGHPIPTNTKHTLPNSSCFDIQMSPPSHSTHSDCGNQHHFYKHHSHTHLHLWLSRLWPFCPGRKCREVHLLPTSHRWLTECVLSGSSHNVPTQNPKYVLSRPLSYWLSTDTLGYWQGGGQRNSRFRTND